MWEGIYIPKGKKAHKLVKNENGSHIVWNGEGKEGEHETRRGEESVTGAGTKRHEKLHQKCVKKDFEMHKFTADEGNGLHHLRRR